ncbi:hypothetical protein D9M70_507520 [compost metagenome]
MEQSSQDVDPLHQSLGKLRFFTLLAIHKLKRDLRTFTQPSDPYLFNERPNLGGRFAKGPIKLLIEETGVPLAVLKEHFVRMRGLS